MGSPSLTTRVHAREWVGGPGANAKPPSRVLESFVFERAPPQPLSLLPLVYPFQSGPRAEFHDRFWLLLISFRSFVGWI